MFLCTVTRSVCVAQARQLEALCALVPDSAEVRALGEGVLALLAQPAQPAEVRAEPSRADAPGKGEDDCGEVYRSGTTLIYTPPS